MLKKFPRIVWNPKFNYRVHTRPYSDPNEFSPPHFINIHINIILPTTSWSSKVRSQIWLDDINKLTRRVL